MKKHPEATALTRENLKQAFWELYCQKKIDHISIQAITDKAGYHRSTFYEYFLDIYDVLTQLEDELLAKMKEEVIHGLNAERTDDFVQTLADLYETQGEYLSVLLGEKGDPHFARKLKAVMGSALTRRFGLTENDSYTSYIVEFGLSAVISTITHWYQSNKSIPAKDLVILIRSMLTYGVFPIIQKHSALPFDS